MRKVRIPFVALLGGVLLTMLAAGAADLATLQPTQVIPLDGVDGRIDHFGLDEKAQKLYVAALGNNTVEVVDLAAGRRADTLKGFAEPQGIAVVTDSQRVVIASGQDGKCRIYDAALKLVATIDGMDDADNARYDAKTKRVIVGYGAGALAIIDPEKGVKESEIRLDAHPESFQIEKQGNRIFVNVPGGNYVAVVDRDKAAVIAKWTLPNAKANYPMALDEANHRLFIGCRGPAKLIILDTETGKAVASIDIVGDTDDIYYDAPGKQLFISGGAGGISVIAQKDADTYNVVGQVPTAPGARTSFYVAATGTLYVAVPHRGTQKAELRAFKLADAPKP